ncbi:MAG: sugar ABC transporter permease [Acidimicrobiia bacterium]|nr:sugar ABC transporter permease [Acidimicrobiia bacterium]
MTTAPAPSSPSKQSSRRQGRVREALTAYAMLAPSLIVFGVFFFYALYELGRLGFHERNRTGTRERWVGVEQYTDVLGGDAFRDGLFITLQFVVWTVPAGLVLGVLLAVAAHRRLKGIRFFQTVFASTVATSVAVASVIFFVLINPSVGYLREVDFISLESTSSAIRGVALSSIWQNLGLTFIIVLAGLQAVPDEVLEAATLDGYGPIRRFFRVTLPLLSPTLLFLVVVLTVFAFQAFAQIDILTQGGPAGSTETLVFKIFRLALEPRTVGEAAVMGVGLFFVTLVVALGQFLLIERRVHYGDR